MLKPQCPSCGAGLELPETLNVAHCMYCGGEIVLRAENALNEMENLERFFKLAQVAIQAKNYQDALKYSNNVLEIDTQNIEAWIIKTEAVFWLSMSQDDKFSTAMQYLEIASRLQPENTQLIEARTRLERNYALWLNHRGLDILEHAREIFNIYNDGYVSGMMDLLENKMEAQEKSGPEYLEAINLFLEASLHDMENIIILRNLRICAVEAHWITWPLPVVEQLRLLNNLEAKELARQKIAGIEKALKEKKSKLRSLEGKKGLRNKLMLADIQDEVNALEKRFRELQSISSYEMPRKNI